jgi:hypothetical protein
MRFALGSAERDSVEPLPRNGDLQTADGDLEIAAPCFSNVASAENARDFRLPNVARVCKNEIRVRGD